MKVGSQAIRRDFVASRLRSALRRQRGLFTRDGRKSVAQNRARAIAEYWWRCESSGGFGFGHNSDSVFRFDALDDFRQLVLTLQSAPGFRRCHHKLENDEATGVLGQRAFHPDLAAPDHREPAFNEVHGPQMVPVIGGEVEEREQRLSISDQAIDGFVVFGRLFLGECRHSGQRRRAVRRKPDFAQILTTRWAGRALQTRCARSPFCAASSVDGASSAMPRRGLSKSPARHRRWPLPARSTNRAPSNRRAIPSSSARVPACRPEADQFLSAPGVESIETSMHSACGSKRSHRDR